MFLVGGHTCRYNFITMGSERMDTEEQLAVCTEAEQAEVLTWTKALRQVYLGMASSRRKLEYENNDGK